MSGSTIVWRLHLHSPPARVFDALSTDAGRAAFWCERSDDRGDHVELTFNGGQVERIRIVECVVPERWVVDYFGTRVRFELADDGRGGTDLCMTNDGVPAEEYLDVLPGWLNVLLPLKAYVDFGVDLHTHDAQRGWRQGYADG
jgi:uncharacterized protein YndB with AHSA1/START domain